MYLLSRPGDHAGGRSGARAGGRGRHRSVELKDLDLLRSSFGHDEWSVLGHSWGTELALLYGLLFEARSTCVVYISGRGTQQWWQTTGRAASRPNVTRRLSPEQVARLSTLSQVAARDADEEVEFRRLSWMTDFIQPDGNEALRAMAEAPFSINFEINRALAAEQMLSDDSLEVHCASTRVPMLFVHGADDPRPVGGPKQVADWAPTATLKVGRGASHLPWVERPQSSRPRSRPSSGARPLAERSPHVASATARSVATCALAGVEDVVRASFAPFATGVSHRAVVLDKHHR